jgi:hypothetical protein
VLIVDCSKIERGRLAKGLVTPVDGS